MRIAFDMLIVEREQGKAQRVARTLLNELARLSAHQFIIITGRPEIYKREKRAANMRLYPIKISTRRDILMEHQLLLPSILRHLQPDILHVPGSIAPIGRDELPILTVYDLATLYPHIINVQRYTFLYRQCRSWESTKRARGIIVPSEDGEEASMGLHRTQLEVEERIHHIEPETQAYMVLRAYREAWEQIYPETAIRRTDIANDTKQPCDETLCIESNNSNNLMNHAAYPPGVSIIIPATRLEKAEQTLTALGKQSYAGQLEIIMVGPPASELAHRWPIRSALTETIYPPGKARNLGAALANGDILLFLDDDMLVAADWVEQNIRALQADGVGAVGARMPGKRQNFYARCADFTNYGHYQHTHVIEELLGAGSMGVHRQCFAELGGFDEKLRSGEDVEFCHRLQKLGYRTLYRPEIVVIHDHHYDTLGKLLRYNYTHGLQGGLVTKPDQNDRGPEARMMRNSIRYPLLFLFLLPIMALWGTIRIVGLNRSDHTHILLYSPYIFLGKLAYQAGVFMSVLKGKEDAMKKIGRATHDMDEIYKVHNGKRNTQQNTQNTQKEKVREYTQNIWHRLQSHMRRQRFAFVQRLLATLPPAYDLLDVGGTPEFWQQIGFHPENGRIILYNLKEITMMETGITNIMGDARDMHEFPDKRFDVVFSNSVIEHVGTYQQQQQMAREIQRIGRRYCVQTPNRYFPIEPHVLWPCFQFLPRRWQTFILTHSRSPWGWRIASKQEAECYVDGIRLLSEKELRMLFPEARLYREKFLGLTKSFLVYHGW